MFWLGGRFGEGGIDADGTDVEVETVDDACGEDDTVGVGDGKVVAVVSTVSVGTVCVTVGEGVVSTVGVDVKVAVGRGDELDVAVGVGVGVGVIDGLDVEVGVDAGPGVGVRVCSVDGQPPDGAGIRSLG